MFGALFFAAMGMLINPQFLYEHLYDACAFVIVTMLGKAILTAIILRSFGLTTKNAIHVGVCLSQIGEFAFILASQGLRAELLDRQTYMLLLGTTALSIFLTPASISISSHFTQSHALQRSRKQTQSQTALENLVSSMNSDSLHTDEEKETTVRFDRKRTKNEWHVEMKRDPDEENLSLLKQDEHDRRFQNS
jgi:hypothetical protein